MPGEAGKKRGRSNGGKKGSRNKKKPKSAKDTKKKPPPIAVAPDGGEYYEAETVVNARITKGVWEYQVRWKGYGPKFDTWEPSTNLCDTLHQVALKFRNRLTLSEEKQEAEEKIDPGDVYPDSLDIFNEDPSPPPVYGIKEYGIKEKEPDRSSSNDVQAPTKDKKESTPDHWEWNDREQVKFREIERINVNDVDARRRVTEARENGVPICLVGHKGWANFSKRWLSPRSEATENVHPVVAVAETGSPATISQVTIPVVAGVETVESTSNNIVQQPQVPNVTQAANADTPNTQPLSSADMVMDEVVIVGNTKDSISQPTAVGLTAPSAEITMTESATMHDGQPHPVDETTIAGNTKDSISQPTAEGVLAPLADVAMAESTTINDVQPQPVDEVVIAGSTEHSIRQPSAEGVTAGNTVDHAAQQLPKVDAAIAENQSIKDPQETILEEEFIAGKANDKTAPVTDMATAGNTGNKVEREKNIDDQPPTPADMTMVETTNDNSAKPPEVSDISSPEVGSPSSAQLSKQNEEATNNGGCSPAGNAVAGNTNVDTVEPMKSINQAARVSDVSSQGIGSQDQAKQQASSNVSSASQAAGLQQLEDKKDTVQESSTRDDCTDLESRRWIDLAEDWEIDVNKMIEDMGEEMVPVVKPHYNEKNPIHGSVRLADFLRRCWPSNGSAKTAQRLYLHQYQFPLSNAVDKLCGSDCHNPLPNDIMGEDLLALWQDGNKGNPYQYIFMGRDETMSKLHRDPGGLAISIAPVVGQKEVLLVHRSDGVSCLSHLQASLEKIDLQNFPLVSQARIYKSVINPGEILLMPQGTFHQCRNITPCLSYSRFHLDTVNLRAFLESCINRDAPEINHEEVLWNCSLELSSQLDKYVDALKVLRKSTRETSLVPSPEIVRKVDTLRALRCISRAICMRYERGDTLSRPDAAGGSQRAFRDVSKCKVEAERWAQLLRDVDSTLHDFRYRNRSSKPQFRAQCQKKVYLKTALEKDLASQPQVLDSTARLALTDPLTVGRKVEANFQGRIVAGEVKRIEVAMQAAFLHFDNLPDVYDEFLPFGALRVPVSGEACVDILPDNVKPGIAVVYPMGPEEYRAIVKSRVEETFVLLDLTVGSATYERWLPRTSILGSKS